MPAKSGERDRGKITILTILWFFLAIYGVLWGVPHVEEDLTERAEAALGEAAVDVRFSGRDATLVASGTAETAQQALATVLAVDGVRAASLDLVSSALEEVTVNPMTQELPSEPVLADPSLTLRTDRGSFALTGSVADEVTVQALTAAALAGYGENRVSVDIEIAADTLSPRWLSDPFPIFAAIGPLELGIDIYDKTMRVTGAVEDEATRTEVMSAIGDHVGTALTLVDRVIIVPPQEAVFSVQANGGSVTLRGTLPSQGEVNNIRAVAEKIYGVDSVATWLTVDPVAPAVPYLTETKAFFQSFEGRTLEFIDTGDQLILRGEVPSEEIRVAIGDALTAAVDPRGLTNDLVVVELDASTQAVIDAINALVGPSVKFGTGSTTLGNSDRAKLDEVATILEDNPDLRVVIEGHTDNGGAALDNQRLSEDRALAVFGYLVEVGVNPDRLSSVGFGEERPIATNNTSSGRAQNRRIEFKVEGNT